MSPRRSRRSQTLPLLILIGIAAVLWYQGKIPGVPRPEAVIPQIKSLATDIPSLKGINTLIPSIPGIGTLIPEGTRPSATRQSAPLSGSLPNMPVKPEPKEITFQGCPPEGDGGDPQLNRLKNRVDEGDCVPVSFDAALSLTWPKAVEQKDRADWSAKDTATIAKYEGIPVVVEGYLTAATESGPESTNCHGTANDTVDWHVSLVKNPGEDRSKAIVTETTPRVRPNHKWSLDLLRSIVEKQERVRISGWLFFDPEHPDHLGKYRATLWEIHPIMQIEVYQDGRWVPLDDLAH